MFGRPVSAMFVAIDFETANSARSSACSIGVVRVEDGEVVDRRHWLIRPRPLVFSPHNVRVHGIQARDVASAPTFAELWPSLRPLLEGQLVLAHNVGFDMGVLQQSLDQHGLPYPSLSYACTVQLARRTWMLPRYDLKTVASSFGFQFQHHQALADAEACARIAIQACAELRAGSLPELLETLACGPGELRNDLPHPPLDPPPTGAVHRPAVRQDEVKPRVNTFDPAHPLFGKRVVFTGELRSMDRLDAFQRVVDAGGSFGSDVNGKTNFLVVGDLDGEATGKLRKAHDRIDLGADLRIVDEDEFLALLAVG